MVIKTTDGKKPHITIIVEGGIVQAEYTNIPGLIVAEIDYDTEGADNEDDLTKIGGDDSFAGKVEAMQVEDMDEDVRTSIYEFLGDLIEPEQPSRLVRRFDGVMVEPPEDLANVVAEYGDGMIVWSYDESKHQIRYGLEVTTWFDDIEAGEKFGLCIHHYAECENKLNGCPSENIDAGEDDFVLVP